MDVGHGTSVMSQIVGLQLASVLDCKEWKSQTKNSLMFYIENILLKCQSKTQAMKCKLKLLFNLFYITKELVNSFSVLNQRRTQNCQRTSHGIFLSYIPDIVPLGVPYSHLFLCPKNGIYLHTINTIQKTKYYSFISNQTFISLRLHFSHHHYIYC